MKVYRKTKREIAETMKAMMWTYGMNSIQLIELFGCSAKDFHDYLTGRKYLPMDYGEKLVNLANNIIVDKFNLPNAKIGIGFVYERDMNILRSAYEDITTRTQFYCMRRNSGKILEEFAREFKGKE